MRIPLNKYHMSKIIKFLRVIAPPFFLIIIAILAASQFKQDTLASSTVLFISFIGTVLFNTYIHFLGLQSDTSRATMAVISKQAEDDSLVKMFSAFRRIQENHTTVTFEILYNNKQNANSTSKEIDYDIAIQVLNYYESIALGISFRAIDQEMYMRWWKNSFTEDWVFLYEFVLGHRCQFNAPRSFIEYETLVTDLLSQEQEEKLKQAKARFSRHKDTPAKKKTNPATAHAATTALLLRAKPAKSYLQH